ncbi:MAG: ribosomal protein [Chryseobacterium sp.]|jgi:four helix bundle protein|uniref:four helix bundle protein n=1 Tax=Chryseobacterium sp. TaxID=1871047 RepID=UPI0026026D01|nr:four helix bundle protein [Chryseobacterium sp.]MDF2551880.1 ribosomal protein [Chryseobacterium sp.]MDF2933628.1 ribosomal protein [Chryseobacterium sp.]
MAVEFENFEVYKQATNLTKNVFNLLSKEKFKKEFELTNQIKRAVLSITNNIAEGSEYNNNAQFIRYLKYSKGSCGEVRNMLNLCLMLYEEDTTDLINDCKIISKQLSKFIDYLSKTDNKKRN